MTPTGPTNTPADQPADQPVDGRTTPRFGNRASGVAAYLGMAVTELSDGTQPTAVLRGPFAAPPHVTDADGRTPTGVLAALVDSIGGLASGIAALPDWIVTTNLTLRRAPSSLFGPTGTGALQLDTEVVRRGRSAVVTRTEVTAADGTTVAAGWMTTARLAPDGGPPEIERPVRPPVIIPIDDPAFRAAPAAFFSLRDGRHPGEVVLDITERTRNPWGILHGGAMAVLADTAATSVVADRPALEVPSGPGPDHVTSDLIVHYLSPARVGPVVATAELVGGHGREHLVRVTVRDHGADDRLLVLAVVTVRSR